MARFRVLEMLPNRSPTSSGVRSLLLYLANCWGSIRSSSQAAARQWVVALPRIARKGSSFAASRLLRSYSPNCEFLSASRRIVFSEQFT